MVSGWWFYADLERFEYWASHVVPHLVVLYDDDAEMAYWAHVTRDAIVRTPTRAKILVPKKDTIDADHADALRRVASTARSVPWQGTAWNQSVHIPQTGKLRYALLTPRLVAPHQNFGRVEDFRPEHALAMLVQLRPGDIEHLSSGLPNVPGLGNASASPHWPWRLVGSYWDYLDNDSLEPLYALVNDAHSSPERVAAIVVLVAGLFDRGEVDRVLEVLEGETDQIGLDPVDRAWLALQQARADRDVGRDELSAVSLLTALAVGDSHSDDLTATAIAGVAAVILYEASERGTTNVNDVERSGPGLGEAIAGLDTMVSWWRTQWQAWGTSAVIDKAFKTWADDSSRKFDGPAGPRDELASAALMANLLGDHRAWRYLTALSLNP